MRLIRLAVVVLGLSTLAACSGGGSKAPEGSCGASGEACCTSGTVCQGALTCQTGICSPASACGGLGQACCTSGTACQGALTCQAGTCAASGATVEQITERALAQQGFAIAFSTTVMLTQVDVIYATTQYFGGTPVTTCTSFGPRAGSYRDTTASGDLVYTVAFYFDSACQVPYLLAHVPKAGLRVVQTGASSALVTMDSQYAEYYGVDGTTLLGTMQFQRQTATLTFVDNGLSTAASGLGTFTPAGLRPVRLGLACSLPIPLTTTTCHGSVLQDFPSLGVAIGSVTALTATFSSSGVGTAGGAPGVLSGPLGSLSPTMACPSGQTCPPEVLGITGGSTLMSTTITDGSSKELAIFPSTASWTVATDAAHDQTFQIAVSNAGTPMTATIKRTSTGATLAEATVDQSGSGIIHYSDGSSAKVTSWTLGD